MINEMEAAHLARDAREARRLRKYGAGFTQEQLEDFQRLERERLSQGTTRLEQLDLPGRAYLPLKRFGVLTLEGVGQILKEDRKPYRFGKKARAVTQQHYNQFQSNLDLKLL